MFTEELGKLVLPDRTVSMSDFFSVYYALTGKVIPATQRRDFLIEYRFRYENSTGWTGDKDSVYQQLLRNFKFDEEKYPDFDSLKKNSKTLKLSPGNSLQELNSESYRFSEKRKFGISSGASNYPLSGLKNPYIKKEKKEVHVLKDEEKMKTKTVKKKPQKASKKKKQAAMPHVYTYEENKMILEAKLSNEEIGKLIGIDKTRVRMQRNNLRYRGIVTVEDLDKKITEKTEKTPSDKEVVKKTEEKAPSKEKIKETQKEQKEEAKGEEENYFDSLINRTIDLMGEFERVSKSFKGKEKDIRTKARYETLLRTLIKKDLQFFVLTAGNGKAQEAQDKYLKSIGFTDVEITYLRGEKKKNEK